MSPLAYLGHIFAMIFLVNGVPHFVQGICGNYFQSPFAKPMGIGLSSPVVNVAWGLFNFAIGIALLHIFVAIEIGLNLDTLLTGAAVSLTALALSNYFGKVRNRQS